jgi:hypothetical protein
MLTHITLGLRVALVMVLADFATVPSCQVIPPSLTLGVSMKLSTYFHTGEAESTGSHIWH